MRTLLFSFEHLREVYGPVFRMAMSVGSASGMRMDRVLLFFWVAGILIGAAALFYVAGLQFCRSARMRDVRPAAMAAAGIGTTAALFGHYGAAWIERVVTAVLQYQWIVCAAPLLLASLIAFSRKERKLCENAV